MFLMLLGCTLQAQMVGASSSYQPNTKSDTKVGFAIYLGGILPNEELNKKYAGLGFDVGMDVLIPISKTGLGFFMGLDYFYNGLNSSWKAEKADNKNMLHIPRVMHLPLTFGIRYLGNFSNSFGLFVEGGAGPNIRMISKYKINYSTLKFDKAITISFKVGTGVMIAKHISIGVDYYYLGNAKVKGIWESDKIIWSFEDDYMTSSELALRVGYRF